MPCSHSPAPLNLILHILEDINNVSRPLVIPSFKPRYVWRGCPLFYTVNESISIHCGMRYSSAGAWVNKVTDETEARVFFSLHL